MCRRIVTLLVQTVHDAGLSGTVHRCCFAAMTFENCTADPRSGNILTSPEVTLSSARKLTFTMASVPYSVYSPVHVYMTSTLGHIDTPLGSYYSDWDTSTGAGQGATYTVCLPVGTYQLVFVATDVENVTRSTAVMTKVLLTDIPCNYTSLAGVSHQ